MNKIDELRHQIILHEKKLGETLEPDAKDLWNHSKVRDQFLEFITDFEILKKNFKRFVIHNS